MPWYGSIVDNRVSCLWELTLNPLTRTQASLVEVIISTPLTLNPIISPLRIREFEANRAKSQDKARQAGGKGPAHLGPGSV